jgi:hypothetical protein
MNNSDMDMFYEEFKNDEEFKEHIPIEEEIEKCCSCNEIFTSKDIQDEQKQFIQSTDCFHLIHVRCMIGLVFE